LGHRFSSLGSALRPRDGGKAAGVGAAMGQKRGKRICWTGNGVAEARRNAPSGEPASVAVGDGFRRRVDMQ
ncbi:MAG TPA: hypothetical protein VM537_11160, partial [Anaerolineae bacterium]|nr:hypothetical protein [Anaerolineae bacterium]